MQRLTAGALMTSALFLAGCGGGSGTFAPHPANQTAPASAARHYNSVADGMAAGVLKPVCGPVGPARARCTSYVVVQSGAATAAQSAQRSASTRNAPDGFGPADLQSAYGLTAAARSKGNDALVAIVDAYDTPQAERDLGVYRARYGLPPCTTANHCFRKVNQKGKTGPLPPIAPPDFAGWQVETALDLELVSANCPKCNILLVESNDDFMNNLGAAVNAAAEFEPAAISNSYVSNESPTDTGPVAQGGLLAYYVHPNIAIVAGSGDFSYMSTPQWDGSVIGPLIPAAFPSVVAVGGTELWQDPTVARGWSESVWSSTGSGCSAFEPMPSWQRPDPSCVGSYTDGKGRTQTFPSRVYGDVAYAADNVAEYDSSGIFGSDGWHVLAGTSIGSPAIAAIYGLAGYGSDGKHDSDDAGFPASKLYTARRGLFDVVSGSNGACSDTYLCSAGPGYDGPTGNGSPNGIMAF